jgi:hypothetical protein
MAVLGLLAVGVFWLDTLRRGVLEGPTVVVLAQEIGGLVTGADVWVAGKPAGRVQSIGFVGSGATDPGLVALRVILRREAATAIRGDATVRIRRWSLLSPPVVKVQPGSPDALPYDFRDTLVVTRGPDMETFRAFADSGRIALEQLIRERARLVAELDRGRGTLPQLRRDPGFAGRLAGIERRAAFVRSRLSERREVHPDGRDPALPSPADRLAQSMETISGMAHDRTATLDPVPEAIEQLAERIRRLDEHMLAARGSTGRLLYDGELQLQSERTRAQLDSLQFELAARPFRWLRFRLF